VTDPSTYDYSQPQHNCDLVMKGGITSGVVYPHAICELAQVYSLKRLGGASAGAIAAAGAAAAEYGRAQGGFAKLAAIPSWVGADRNLFLLFRPEPKTKPIFALLEASLDQRKGKALRLLGVAVRRFWIHALVGALPGAALLAFALVEWEGALSVVAAVVGLLLLVLGAVVGALVGVLRRALSAIPGNGYGLCSGLGDAQTLTPWLADTIDDLAGRTGGRPLTFGDLWAGPAGDGTPERPHVALELMTTNLTQRRPQRLPWDERAFFFDPGEFRRLFPERVVAWMEQNPPPEPPAEREQEEWKRLLQQLAPLRPLPTAADLPVVVATRMSLSFPILLSAVPLWSVDWSRHANQRALSAIRSDSPDDAAERVTPEVCWFSDGGISSNFPVHFFDAPLPRWPTFAINLRGFHPDYSKQSDESKNVYLPELNVGGLLQWWSPFPKEGRGRLVSFGNAVVRTMQNRVDEAQLRQPGYRDRIVNVGTSHEEGGMNLDMPAEVIAALTERGQHAGAALVERFVPGEDSSSPGWDNHRWVRYRSAVAALAELAERFDTGFATRPLGGERTFMELAIRGDDDEPASYRWRNVAQRELGLSVTSQLAAAGAAHRAAQTRLDEGAPHPTPEARIVPRD
jgi:predicted acylesterase/phospholipase RssA